MPDFDPIFTPRKLKAVLRQPLPGREAQFSMAPDGRELGDPRHYDDAAVLVAVHRQAGRWGIPLIHRAEDGYAHGGQVSFPGGRLEPDETLSLCAAREAEEEIGVNRATIEQLGALTPLPIPVSRFVIHPFVATIPDDASFTPDPREVQRVLFLPLDRLLAPDARKTGEITLPGRRLRDIPYLELDGLRIWGATAMVLGEFAAVLRASLDAD